MAPAPPASPQKRVTRARAAAKKVDDTLKEPATKTIQNSTTRKKREAVEEESIETDMPVVDGPLRKSARRVGRPAAARRIKITPLNGTTESQDAWQEEDNPPETAPNPRATRSKKATADGAKADETEPAPVATRRKRQAIGVAKEKNTTQPTVPKLRGRPKKAEVVRDNVVGEAEKAPRASRARVGSDATSTKALAVPPSKTTMSKKKVTFQDLSECDKENRPVLEAKGTTKGKSAAPASGIRAKPVRRPAATSRATKQNATNRNAETIAQRILTPKKVTQIAKSCSPTDSDEDELNGAKTPIRDLSQSPRRNINIARTGSPVKKLDFGHETFPSSPVKSQLTSTLLSPAKRPAPSPFRDALKESPRRGDFAIKFPQVPKFNAMDKAKDPSSPANTVLLQSPKRVPLETAMYPQSMSKAGKSPFKASLLQSPPKRPISPMKSLSPVKATMEPGTPLQEVDAGQMSPTVVVSSHFRASVSAERSSRVQKFAPEESEEETKCAIDFDESIVDIRSPLKLNHTVSDGDDQFQENSDAVRIVESDLREYRLLAQVDELHVSEESLIPRDRSTVQVDKDVETSTAAPSSVMLRGQTPINTASFLFRASQASDDEESSEDELQSPVRTYQPQTPAIMLDNRSRLSVTNRASDEQKPGFTPLAAQLSGWLASSPNKQRLKNTRPRGIFSPIAAQHVPGEVIIDRRSPATSRVSTGSRRSMSARRSVGSRKSLGQRSSLAISTTGTPDRSSYFADEMVVKDLEETIENMQDDDQECDMLQEAGSSGSDEETLRQDVLLAQVAEEKEIVPALQAEDSNVLVGDDSVAIAQGDLSRDLSPGLDETMAGGAQDRGLSPETSRESTASSAYGDENVLPTSPAAVLQEPVHTDTESNNTTPTNPVSSSNRAPLNEFTTPSVPQLPRFANTVVSKVPLRPEGHTSAIKLPKKRSRSLSAGLSSVKKTPILHASGIPRSSTVNTFSSAPQSNLTTPSSQTTTPDNQQSFIIDDFGDETLDGIDIDSDDDNLPPITPTATGTSIRTFAVTPSKTSKAQDTAPSASAPASASASVGVLQGAVVLVDVHTTEGADASGIFIELLTQMGAKCVRSWGWNPRASMGVGGEDAAGVCGGKIGITHVVYKDGGKRTLEKVRDTEGVVRCVGVGWVLDCERANKWLDESAYAVDTSILPRGGSRRRKSMEPRALLNLNGNLSQVVGGKRSVSAEMMQRFKDELVNTPGRGRECDHSAAEGEEAETEHTGSVGSGFSTPTGVFAISTSSAAGKNLPPATPTGFVNYDPSLPSQHTPAAVDDGDDAAASYSPATPYYLTQGAKLVQMTCPPKQTGKGLFARDDDEDEEGEGEGSNETGLRREGKAGFPISGRIGDVKDEAVRRRLVEARRKTLGWKPRVGSPLGR